VNKLANLLEHKREYNKTLNYRRSDSEDTCKTCTHSKLRHWTVPQAGGAGRVSRSGLCCDILCHYLVPTFTCDKHEGSQR
jgi:hypothetical protein